MLDIYGKSSSIASAVKARGEQTVRGWLYRKRSSGGKIFTIVHDSTGTLQCVVDRSAVKDRDWNAIDGAYLESSVMLKGRIKKDERAPGGFEMDVKELTVVHSGEQFPITEYQSAELLLDKRHLWLRSQKMIAVMKCRAYVFMYAREYLDKNGFYEIHPPVITKAGGETGSDMFEVKYFGEKAYLTESSQLYAEAMLPALEKVYSLTPAFRAEKSRTVKHIAELWMLEPEMAYFNQEMNMKLQEELISYIANKLAKEHENELKILAVDREPLLRVKPPFKRISYERALKILNEKGAKKKWGDDFGVEDEKLLTENERMPIFVHSFAKELKAFYAPINESDPKTVASADMLAPRGHGEIIGGTEREWRLEEVLKRMKEIEKVKGIKFNMQSYDWWLDLRRYGSVPHAGFGMGMERVIKWLLNLDHIRDAIPFPRMINRLMP